MSIADINTCEYLEPVMQSTCVHKDVTYHITFEGDGLDYIATVKETGYWRPWGFSDGMPPDEVIVEEALASIISYCQ